MKLQKHAIYVGFLILDLSKVLMYEYHCQYMKEKYGFNAQLLFTDMDSLCYDVKTQDIYRHLRSSGHHDSLGKLKGNIIDHNPKTCSSEMIGTDRKGKLLD